ncbi:MAG: dTDP-glucose 4,6-dehydratase [Planctomycetota bacterium]
MRTYLVTGGAGFIGSNFVHYLRRHYPKDRVVVLDALTYAGSLASLPPFDPIEDEHLKFWYGNVKNGPLVDAVVGEADVVVHFAAETHVTRSIYDNYSFFETDVLGTQTVANAIVKHKERIQRFVHISSSEVYGTAETPKMAEDHPLEPRSPYASAKAGADRLVASYFYSWEIPAVILRPFNNFGPRQHLEKVIPRFTTSSLMGEDLHVHGDGEARRDFIFVEETCRAIDLAIQAPRDKVVGQVINIGTGDDISTNEIADKVLHTLGRPATARRFIGDRPGQVRRHTAATDKAKRLLGFENKVGFDEGLARTIAWYRENKKWWEPQLWMRRVPIRTAEGKVEYH